MRSAPEVSRKLLPYGEICAKAQRRTTTPDQTTPRWAKQAGSLHQRIRHLENGSFVCAPLAEDDARALVKEGHLARRQAARDPVLVRNLTLTE